MKPPHEEQYTMEGSPSAYMSMRNYINQAWQNQPHVERNPSEYRSMSEYRDQMSAHVYSVPSTYAPLPHPQYASWSQPQPPQPISPIEQAILDLIKLVGDAVVEQKEFNAQLSEKIHIEENSLDQRLDGLNNDFEHEWDNLQDSIEDLIDLQQCPLEEECQSGTMVEESCLQQPQESLVENFESSDICAVVCLWEKKEAIPLLLTEEAVEEHKENNLPLPPTDSVYILPLPAPQSQPKTPTANAQATYNPLPVYILPVANSKPTAPAPKAHASPSLLVQNFMKLMVIAQTFATTSKTQAVVYIA